ncbi:glycerophosphodiester phosphodiesterase [Xaviernesmea oryzae]|uniref:Glycerophosphodiester phosphodiesterase n=1 Tax=Xaviernesmea oryzae TaxID=464029 RepID=A0A1Q9AU31_9HYPH|nr:glycerophosphodiester phosphodiesterase family protein [Xaviernesmea oryzae]OLP58878.1 glycerophosphodiester phosphodiesterase [Xaviernesmea oryzae]SEM03104.1 glycerophosphoryl diester phosphodiesterase [Xaviernesmea oryzae]
MSLSQTAAIAAARDLATLPLLDLSNPAILTVAHRGVWTSAPENSLPAIRDAIALGVEIVEVDVQSTADGHLVIMHDETIDRTSTGSGTVSELPFATVRAATLRACDGGETAEITSEQIPTLEEALEEARGRVVLNLDTKYARDLDAVVATVKRLGSEADVVIKSPINTDEERAALRDAPWYGTLPHMPLMKARPGRFVEDLAWLDAFNVQMIEVKFTDLADLDAARDTLKRRGVRLWINTLDCSHNLDLNDTRALQEPDAVWGRLIEAGAGAIQTDTNEAFKAWLAARQG